MATIKTLRHIGEISGLLWFLMTLFWSYALGGLNNMTNLEVMAFFVSLAVAVCLTIVVALSDVYEQKNDVPGVTEVRVMRCPACAHLTRLDSDTRYCSFCGNGFF